MCGIAGILRYDDEPVDRAALLRMQEVLTCRGPDDRGLFVDGRLGFVHTRLAILDPAHGRQPMTLPDRKLTVVFNGEIYNHRELRADLEATGCRFTTDHSDTEVLLHGYRTWEGDLPTYLRGMYAFAIWDGEELFLARDRVGKKPLFIYQAERFFMFASTPAVIRAALPGKVNLDRDALHGYLAYGYTVAQTPLSGVIELPPMKTVLLSPRRSSTPPPRSTESIGAADAEKFTRLITEAVRMRLEADVPLGCFLSGGIDSSLVAAIAQQELAKRGERLKTFCVSMPDADYDEAPFARRVADHIGSEHHELRAEPKVEEDLLFLTRTMGEPFADSSILPTYWLSRAAREHVKVALSGDGGDEVFVGYERYAAARFLQTHAWWLGKVPAFRFGGEQKTRRAKLRRLAEAARLPTEAKQYLSLVRLFTDEQIRSLGVKARNLRAEDYGEDQFLDTAASARWWDFMNYLPGDLLRKVDRASMAVGLEVRCPLLDEKVADAAIASKIEDLMPGRRTKQMLRDVARPFLPAEIISRKKMGFAPPIGGWFNGPLQAMLRRWLLDEPHLESIGLRRAMVEALIRDHAQGREHTHRLYALLSLSMWLAWRDEATHS